MKIWLKVAFVVLPVLLATLVIGGVSSYLVAVNAVNRVTTEFLDFKVSELENYMTGQWDLLVQNGLTGDPVMERATQAGIEVYAEGLIRSETELIFALDQNLDVAMATGEVGLSDDERTALGRFVGSEEIRSLQTIRVADDERIAMGFTFDPFSWLVIVSEDRTAFYTYLNRITIQTVVLIIGGTLFSLLLILFFVRYTMQPLSRMAGAMKEIISSNDLSARVAVEHDDEIGQVSHTFNIMVGELDKAYSAIKQYAFDAVVAQKKESKIRNIFQKYVPQELIDRFFQNPESMLVGEDRELAILFSDIRSFTSISERMAPDDLVGSLNRYFSMMVDIIMNRQGVVDKYIGDAIMALFGAPVQHADDPVQAVLAGIEMATSVHEFNRQQVTLGKPEFKIGVGISYGSVTVGNIGTERKMDYTVIGDMVNLASRLEGLTKRYQQEIIISASLYDQVRDDVYCRLLDMVAVKGRSQGERIYAPAVELSPEVRAVWDLHNRGMEEYFAGDFGRGYETFSDVASRIGPERITSMMMERCERYLSNPPPENWNGVEVITTK